MFWGAVHALSPGHGKSIVAAYLVGSRGTARHAAFLGMTVTVTHTASIFVLGIVTLYLSHYILPETLYPWLSVISGLVVVAMGGSILVRRARRLRTASHHHHHDHDHAHEHDTITMATSIITTTGPAATPTPLRGRTAGASPRAACWRSASRAASFRARRRLS